MTSTMSAWRAAVDPDDLREYDRFGPWIDRVTDAADMPRRFRPWAQELSSARYVLKVPRSYDRAQVRPGMDLYESVIAVFADKICVLHAKPTEIVRRDVARDEVVATVRYSNLLIGRWSMLLSDASTFTVDFNNVSHATIAEVDQYLMSHASDLLPQRLSTDVRPQYHFFKSVVSALNAEMDEPVRTIHVEEPGQSCRNERNRRRRSAGMMVLASTDDLVIVNRDMAAQPRFRRANYASNVLRIPFRLMTSFDVRTPLDTFPAGFSQLVITCDRQVITQPCLYRPDAVANLLSEQGVPAGSSR
jgi:hypothetical protein